MKEGKSLIDAQENPLLIGWREWVSLPDICLPAIKAKIDTGARTSALHTFFLETVRQDGIDHIRFKMHPLQRKQNPVITCMAPLKDERMVSDSGGHRELRPVIESTLEIAGRRWSIELTLTNRENMLFRMLLGRTSMTGRVQIDPARSYITGKQLARSYRKPRLPKTKD